MKPAALDLLLAAGCVAAALAVAALGAVGLLVWLAGGRNTSRAKVPAKPPPGFWLR